MSVAMENSCMATSSDGQQCSGDLVHTLAGLATGGDDLDVRLQGVNVLDQVLHADFHRLGKVDLVDDDDLGPHEHVRVLLHHVRSFGHAYHDHAGLGAK